jgi:hypothetical protein
MPLSEHEKRLLSEIEQTLRSDDPALALSMRSSRRRLRVHTLILLTVAAAAVGGALLVAGLRLADAAGTVLGVAGFAVVIVGSDCGLRAFSRIRHDRRGSSRKRPPAS